MGFPHGDYHGIPTGNLGFLGILMEAESVNPSPKVSPSILDTPISLEKEFKVALKNIFGFSYIKLRHLNKVFGVNTRSNYKLKDLHVTERNLISFYLPLKFINKYTYWHTPSPLS